MRKGADLVNGEFINVRVSDDSMVKLEYHERLDSVVSLAREHAQNGYPDRYINHTESKLIISTLTE